MADTITVNENSQELEEGEINDDLITESADDPDATCKVKPIGLFRAATDCTIDLDRRLFGKADIDLRSSGGKTSSTKAKERLRKKFGSSRNPVNNDRSYGSANRPQKAQKSRKRRNTSYPTSRPSQFSNSRTERRWSGGSKTTFRGRTRYTPRQPYNQKCLPSSMRKTYSSVHTTNIGFKPFPNLPRPNAYSSNAGQTKSLSSIDQEASYEDLLDQYKLIKLELGLLKKEEAKLTENEKASFDGRIHSQTGSRTGGGNDKENKHQSRHYSRSPSKGKSKATRTESVLLDKNDRLEKPQSSLKLDHSYQDVQGKETPKSPCEEEEDEMELRRMALASCNREVNLNNKRTIPSEAVYLESYHKRRVSRENSNPKMTSSSMDNYESVDMDLDSDCVAQATDLSEVEMDTSDDNGENRPEDDEDERLLREQLLKSLERRRNLAEECKDTSPIKMNISQSFSPVKEQHVTEVPKESLTVQQSTLQIVSTAPEPPSSILVTTLNVPPMPNLVINLAEDSSSDESDCERPQSASSAKGNFLDGLDSLLREARLKTEISPPVQASTPAAVSKLSKAQQLEYRKLKAEIAKRELHQPKVQAQAAPQAQTSTQTAQPLQESTSQQQQQQQQPGVEENIEGVMKEKKNQLEKCEQKLKAERVSLAKERERLGMLQQLFVRRKRLVDLDASRLEKLRKEMSALETNMAKNSSFLSKVGSLVQGARTSVSKHMLAVPKLERECNRVGRLMHGTQYKLPPAGNTKAQTGKRKVSLASASPVNKSERTMLVTVANRNVQSVRSSAELLAEKVRLQQLEQDIAKRLEELRTKSNAGSPKPEVMKAKKHLVINSTLRHGTAAIDAQSVEKTKQSTASESSNPWLDVPDKDQPRQINLSSVFEITESQTKEDQPATMQNDLIHIEDKVISKMTITEPDFFPLAISPDAFPFQFSSGAQRKLSFCLSAVQVSKSLTLENKKNFFNFIPYESPLLHFSSYRLNPRFKSESGQLLGCNTYTSKVNTKVQLCKFDLTGTCNDDQCKWQHSKNYICKPVDIVADILSFCPKMSNITSSDNREKSQEKLYKYAHELLRNGPNDLEVLLEFVARDVCKRLRITPPHFVQLYKRQQKLRLSTSTLPEYEESTKVLKANVCRRLTQYQEEDSFVDPETDIRYFEPVKGFVGLEEFLMDNPFETKLWLKLASHHMNGANGDLNRALDVLSRALETNREDVELWQRYLTLFSGHPDSKDILSLCQQALEFTRHYPIWWKYLELSVGFQSKSQVCQEILAHLLSSEGQLLNPNPSDLSHRLLETFLYLVQLHLQTGRIKNAVTLFQHALHIKKEEEEVSEDWSVLTGILPNLSGPDLVLAWLSFLNLLVHKTLPVCLFRGSTNQPSILANKEPFVISWPKKLNNESSVASLLVQAISSCTNVASPEECWPLHLSLLNFHTYFKRDVVAEWELAMSGQKTMLASFENQMILTHLAIEECRNTCVAMPGLLQAWICLAHLYIQDDKGDDAEKVLREALEAIPHSPQLCNTLATFYLDKACSSKAITVLANCVKPYIELANSSEEEASALHIYKLLLDHHHDEDIPLKLVARKKEISFSEEEKTYLWLNLALYLECAQAESCVVVDIFESAIVSIERQCNLEILWWRYLQYTLRCIHMFDDMYMQGLVFQCLRRLPSTQSLAHWPGRSRLNYRFHNSVIQMYCQSLSSLEERIALCQELLQHMPRNEWLIQRLVLYVLEEDGSRTALEVLGNQLGSQIVSPTLWRITTRCVKLLKRFDLSPLVHLVRKLYQRALKAMPYTRCLWKDLLVLEDSEGTTVEPLLQECRELGILVVEEEGVGTEEEADLSGMVLPLTADCQ